jgi:hypothetical protein
MHAPPSDAFQSPTWELTTLRQELLLRIRLQNLLLMIAVGVFAAFAALGVTHPRYAWLAAAAQGGASLALALQWCHHGIRTRQIKQYLLVADPNPAGWERWLPANRPPGLLGARWMVSTKGVFLGLGLGMMGIAAFLEPAPAALPMTIAPALWAASLWFLITNPKE